MNRTNKWIKSAIGIVFLSFILVVSQFNININGETEINVNDKIVKEIINTKDTKVINEELSDINNVEVSMDFHISNDAWKQIKEYQKPIEIKFPEYVTFEQNQELEFLNTDKNFEEDTLHSLDSKLIRQSENGFELDFTGLDTVPEDFKINYVVKVDDGFDNSKEDEKEYPVLETLNTLITPINTEEETSVEEVPAKQAETPNTNETTETQEVETDPNPVISDDRIVVNGNFSLELKGEPKARIKYNGNEINANNPINMQSYSETGSNYTIDLFTDSDNSNFSVEYLVKLDEASLAKITKLDETTIINFKNEVNGEQQAYEYEYTFPNLIKFHQQTGDSILASSKLGSYLTSSFDRVDPESNEGTFKLVLSETSINSNNPAIPDQYKLQDYITYQINEYIFSEFQKGTSLEEVKDALRKGIVVADDAYNMNGFSYTQKEKSSFETLKDYPFEMNNVLNSGKDIVMSLPVTPIGGQNHKVDAQGFEQITNGFELTWSGVVNTTRKINLDNLSLNFNEPSIVKTSGIANWTIKTKVVASFYEVLNDGTLVPSTTLSDVTVDVTNTANNKIDPIIIPFNQENVAVKYEVVQTYTNSNLNLEIEGKQVGRLNAYVNSNQYGQGIENSKEFPRSLTIKGVKDSQGSPTSLIWNVVYNNNELVRQPNDGFNFDLDPSKIKVSTYTGTGSSYTDLGLTYSQLDIETSITVDGKKLSEDGRFDVSWNSDFTKAEIRIKPGVVIDKEVKFQFKYDIDVQNKVSGTNNAIKDEFFSTSKIRFDGSANVSSFSNGNLITPSNPTAEELKDMEATNYLILFDKKPIMIDYRTKEIIWGVTINTVTAERIGLPGLTFADKFGEGLEFSPLDENNPILMFKVDSSKTPKTSYGDYSKFISGIQKIMDDRQVYSDEIADKIIGVDGLINQPIDSENENSKLFNEVISAVSQGNIYYTDDTSGAYSNEDYVVSLPQLNPNYATKLPSVIQNGDGDPYDAVPTKNDALSDKDIRIDFVSSNAAINGSTADRDDNAYYIVYKTTLNSDKPLDKVSNDATLLFANWIPGTSNQISWIGGEMIASKDLGEVAKYNAVPKKTGTTKPIYDAATQRNRLAVEWQVTFNYDIDTRRLDTLPMRVVDTIDKTKLHPNHTLGNEDLVTQDIDKITLVGYTVDKEGNLNPSSVRVDVTKASGELVINETNDKIEYLIQKELDPQYVYRFIINTFIVGENADIVTPAETESNVVVNGLFENQVTYTRASQTGLTDFGEPGVAIAEATLNNTNRVAKTGGVVSGSYTGSRQEVLWTLSINYTYENMNDLVITDTLESKHTFKYVKNASDLEHNQTGPAVLDRFVIQEYSNGAWRNIAASRYTLTNLDGFDDKPLDNWLNGESGFILKFNETMSNPIQIKYATFGHVVDNKEIPLINKANIKYESDASEALEHDVLAKVNFTVNNGAGGYEEDTVNLGLTLRYNDNQPALTTDLDKGQRIQGNNVEKSIIILYRYQQNFVQNNHVYRIGQPDETGYLEFSNVEKGNYIVKQYYAADGYSVPYTLGYVESNRVVAKDKSVEINNNQLASGNLVTLNVKEDSGFLGLFGNRDTVETLQYAIYNTTPVFEVNTVGKTYTSAGLQQSTNLAGIELDVEDENNTTQNFTSSSAGKFSVGTVEATDPRIGFGEYTITQPSQDLDGYLLNTETITHNLLSNPNGTLDATTASTSFSNYLTNAHVSVVRRGTTTPIASSTYNLEIFENGAWKAYTKASSSCAEANGVYTIVNGSCTFYNLEVGAYRLVQLSVGEGYLLNETPLEFYAYGPTTQVDNYEGLPDVMELTFSNIKTTVTIQNTIGNTLIDGSTFNILDEDDAVVETFSISDATSGYTLELAPGTYSLVETATTQSRPLNLNPMTFVVEDVEGVFEGETESSERNIVFINHLGSVNFETHTPNDETFDLESYEVTNTTTSTVQTDINSLHSGNYEVNDIVVPSSWIYVDMDQTFNIPASYTDATTLNKTVHVYATLGSLEYVNLDGDHTTNTTPLTNGEFTLSNSDVTLVNSNNDTVLTNIQPGTYEFAQTKAPQGYGLNTYTIPNIDVPSTITQSDVTINLLTHEIGLYDLNEVTYYNYRGKVLLTKESFETQEKLENVVFDLYYENVKVDGSYTTDGDGEIYIEDLAPGNYYFEEVQGEGTHVVTANKTPFTISSSNLNAYDVHEVTVLNYYADVEFKNIDPENTTVYTDGKFTLYTLDGTWKQVDGFIDFIANPDTNKFHIFGVKPGTYKLIQTVAPTNTVRNTYEYEFEIPEYLEEEIDGRKTIVLDDYINYQATIKVNVIDDEGEFSNEIHAILQKSNARMMPIVLDSTLTQDKLGSGVYDVVTTKAQGAIVYDEVVKVEVPQEAYNDEGLVLEKTVRVTYAKHIINLIDGKTQEVLSSGTYDINGDTYSIDENKALVLDKLGPNTYTYKQTKAADHYVLNTLNEGSFEVFDTISQFDPNLINEEGYPYVVFDTVVHPNYQVDLIINKTDNAHNPLKDVVFGLEGNTNHFSAITDVKGIAKIERLEPGVYTLQETKGLEGYKVSDQTIEIKVVDEAEGKPEDINVTVINDKIVVEDKTTTKPSLPETGVSNELPWTSMILVIIGSIFVFVTHRKQKN